MGRSTWRRIVWLAVLLSVVLGGPAGRSAAPAGGEPVAQAAADPAFVIRGAVTAIYGSYYEPLNAGDLFADAWDGAERALAAAGAGDLPPKPAFPGPLDGALNTYNATFPALAARADGRLTNRAFVDSTLGYLTERRHDCHTYYATPDQVRNYAANNAGDAVVGMGFRLGHGAPLHVAVVEQGSPAEAAGLRRGQAIMSVNGVPVAALTPAGALKLLNRAEGTANAITVREHDGAIRDLTVSPSRYTRPMQEHAILPGGVGLIRWYSFVRSPAQIEQIKAALAEFEAAGVRAWIFDLRWNAGGSAERGAALARLFAGGGERLWSYHAHDGATQIVAADGQALPTQRPLAILVDRDTVSMAEFLAGGLQGVGRATLVGRPTAGCIGLTQRQDLADGSAVWVTQRVGLIGPLAANYHRVGVPPDRAVVSPVEAVLAGRDPQLDHAVALLADRLETAAVRAAD